MSSPKEDYSSLEIARDATDFINSRFGQRYMSRLKDHKKRLLDIVGDKAYATEYRASAGSEYSAIQGEIDYFMTAQNIMKSPNLIKRLQNKLTEKNEAKVGRIRT